jgi:predicted nucleic acid-binding protein
VNVLGKKIGHEAAFHFATYMLSRATFHLAEASQATVQAALAKFQKQPSSVSFTDCIVMAVADEYETKVIFGFDRVFMQNGYHILPLHPKA